MPHFFVDDGFSDSKEVLAIPARHRLAAVGLWTLAGSWSANKLQDGFVSDEALKRLGARPVLVDSLCNIVGLEGEDWSLWIRVAGGIRFANWSKWQRTRDQVVAYRQRQADKKRHQREAGRTDLTSDNNKMSPGDNRGDTKTCPPGTPQTPIPIPKPKYVSGSVSSELTHVDAALESISATPGADLVRKIIPSEFPDSERTMLRLKASELLHRGTPTDVVAEALQAWVAKPGVGPGILPSLVSDVIKRRASPLARLPNGTALALQGADLRAAENEALKHQLRQENT